MSAEVKLKLDRPRLLLILKKAEAEWFDIEEVEDNEALLATREHGDVGDERAGQKDIDAARRIARVIRSEYPDMDVSLERVDEWVHVNIEVKK